MSGRDACEMMEAPGNTLARQRGSRRVMQRQLPGTTVTVLVPDHAEPKTGTLHSIIRQSGLPRELFES